MPLGIPDTRAFPWDQSLKSHLGQLNNGATGGINTWAVNPTVGVDGLALGANHIGYTGINTTTNSLMRWDGTAWSVVMDSPKAVLGSKLVLYVSQNTGNDSNDGMTSSTAWKTTSKLYQELMRYDYLEKQIDIYLGAGAYNLGFPPIMERTTVRVYGASSASVNVQRLDVAYKMNVTLQGVTIGFSGIQDSTYFFFPIIVSDGGTFSVGPDVVFGPMGNYIAGRNMVYIVAMNNSFVNFFGNAPTTVTGNVNTFCIVSNSSQLRFNQPGGAPTTTPGTAPQTSNGNTYDTVAGSMTAADTLCTINCVGNLSIGTFFSASDSSSIRPAGARAVITGNVTGVAYSLTSSSYINVSVIRGTPATNIGGIGFPMSVSPGTKDATSVIYGTTF